MLEMLLKNLTSKGNENIVILLKRNFLKSFKPAKLIWGEFTSTVYMWEKRVFLNDGAKGREGALSLPAEEKEAEGAQCSAAEAEGVGI